MKSQHQSFCNHSSENPPKTKRSAKSFSFV